MMCEASHSQTVVLHWEKLENIIKAKGKEVTLNGSLLGLAAVVAVARYAQRSSSSVIFLPIDLDWNGEDQYSTKRTSGTFTAYRH